MKKILLLLSAMLVSLTGFAGVVTDKLTADDFLATTTSYTAFTGVQKNSAAVYAGQSAKDAGGYIQMRSKNSDSGIVSTTSGGKVKSVTITVGKGTNTVDVYGSNTPYTSAADLYATGNTNQGTKVGSVTVTGTVTFTEDYKYVGIRSYSGAIYLTSVEIEWTTAEEGSVNAPSFTPSEGKFVGSVEVSLKADTGCDIYYTLDGTDPTTASTKYTAPFTLTETATVKAIAHNGTKASNVVSKTYTRYIEIANTAETAYTVAQAIEVIDNPLSDLSTLIYVKGTISKIDEIDTEGTFGNATYYIQDEDGTELEVYRGYGLNGQKFNEEGATLIEVGNKVVVYGKVKKFNTTYEFDTASQIVSLTAAPTPDPIVFTDQLTVTVNDVSGTLDASVNLIKHEDGTIDFSLPNFVLAYGEDVMPVGNININGLTLVPGEKYDTFEYNDMLAITAGDLEGIDFWMGPMLGEMPLKLQGKVNFDDHKLFVNIDIDLSESLAQIINVKFGTDFTEPAEKQFVLGPEDVSANKAYIIYTEARGGLTVVGEEATALNGTSEAGVGQTVEDTNVLQQFAFVGYEGDYYLYSLGAKKYVSVSGLTEKAANPVQFADADESTVRLYLDGSHNFNLGGSKQFTCDGWKYKDAGNSFIIKAVADFDQSALVEAIAADIQQSKLNAALAEAIAEAQAAYDIHNIAGDALIHEADQFSSPFTTTDDQCDDIDEVYTYLLDNDAKTYWHSAWEEGEQPMHTHYLQVNLAELVDGDMLLQMTRRNVLGNHITKMSVEASTDGVDFTQVAAFELPYNAGGETVSAEFKLDTPATFLRFFADETVGNQANLGYWHAAEFQLFKAIDLPRNVINADLAAALLEAIETAKAVENATQEDVDALVQALSLYNANIMNEPVVPVEPDTETMYFTAEQLRNEVANIGQALIGVLNVTTTADKYVTETLRSSEASADGTLAGVRAPQEEEVFEVLAAEGGYVLRHHNAAEGEGYLGLNGNTFTVTDQAGATIWTILGPDEEGYGSVTSFDDLYPDIAAELNPNMVRFIAQGQYLNGQNFENIGGIRGGTGAWSFNYVRNANYEVEEPEVITYTIKFVNAPEDGAYLQIDGNWYSEGETVESEDELTAEDITVSCDPAYTYEISIENGVITVTFQKPDGINGISGDAKNATIYNLQGQRINAAGRGLNVVNGKVVLKK